MRRDVIAMGMRNKRERLRVPRVEPDVFLRQINAAVVSHFYHGRNLLAQAAFDISALFPFHYAVKALSISILAFVCAGNLWAGHPIKILTTVDKLPVALSDDFQFRKTKLFYLDPNPPKARRSLSQAMSSNPNSPTAGIAEASLGFERTYRLYGAISNADRNQRYGNYFDFFWRAKRPANVTVRLEYRQEKLRSFVQAREISYQNVKGTNKTEFAIIGDDYLQDGRVTAWRCLLIENGRIVAENRSYLWE
ncbi:MAG: hypothetical protein QOD64_694 [Verrucomicrobiota bacterium]